MRERGKALASRHGLTLKKMGADGTGVAELSAAVSGAGKTPDNDLPAGDRIMEKRRTLAMTEKLARDPEVAWAEPNFIMKPALTPNDTYFPDMWNLDIILAPEAWDGDTGDPNTIISVIDSGVLYNHPDLADNILKDGATVVGYDMVSDPISAIDGDGPDPDPLDPGDGEGPGGRSTFHGTHVAGTAAAVTDNSTGVAGVSWHSRIMPVRVLGRGGGSTQDVAEGIRYAAGLDSSYTNDLPTVGGDTVRSDVINLSLGGYSQTNVVTEAVNEAIAKDVILVAAAGNEGVSNPFYPAADQGVIGVSAVDRMVQPAYYSNFGPYVDVAAPGGDVTVDLDTDGLPDGILSTLADDLTGFSYTYAFYQGTSMAAPHVSGVIALMKSTYPGLGPMEFMDILSGSTEHISRNDVGSITNYPKGSRDDLLGYGLIDARAALHAAEMLAGDTSLSPPELQMFPSDLYYGFNSTQLSSWAKNSGDGDLGTITATNPGVSWVPFVSVSGQRVDITVDRTTLADGLHETGISVSSASGGTDTVTVHVLKGATVTSDLGTLYVLLLNPDTGALRYSTSTTIDNDFIYIINGVAAGGYFIAAGTDLDGDGFVGDSGEAFGMYPNVQDPTVVEVGSGQFIVGLNFPIGFVGLPSGLTSAGKSDRVFRRTE